MKRVVFAAIGIALLVASLVKFHLFLTDPFADLRIALPQSVLALVAIAELFAAVCCFVFLHRSKLAQLGIAALFLVFLSVSLIRAALGVQDCGCFGTVSVSPLQAAIFSALPLLGLFVFRQQNLLDGHALVAEARRILNWCGTSSGTRIVGGAATIVAILFINMLAPSGMIGAVLWGEPLSVRAVEFHEASDNEVAGFQVELFNRTSDVVRVIGANRSCGCLSVEGIPQTFSPGSSGRMFVGVQTTSLLQPAFRYRVVLWAVTRSGYHGVQINLSLPRSVSLGGLGHETSRPPASGNRVRGTHRNVGIGLPYSACEKPGSAVRQWLCDDFPAELRKHVFV